MATRLRTSAKWLFYQLEALSDPRGYFFLSLPFQKRQRIYSRATRSLIRYTVRELADYAVLLQVYGSKNYDVAKLARGEDLLACYAAMLNYGRTPLIVDCGANIGASANYFSECYPKALVVAIEPETGNFASLQQHRASQQITCLNAAIAGCQKRGRILDPGNGAWSFQVEVSEEGAVEFMTFDGLLADPRFKDTVPFIAKIDIEGFEQDLFAGSTEWLDRFPLVVIELHDGLFPRQANSRGFLEAVAARNRDFLYRGENVFSIAN